MGKILVYTNLTTSTDVVAVENFLRFSGHDFSFESFYYNHVTHAHTDYDKSFALVDTSCMVVSDEFKEDLLHKVETLVKKGVRIVLCNFWESKNQILATEYPQILRQYEFDIWHGGTLYFWFILFQHIFTKRLNIFFLTLHITILKKWITHIFLLRLA